MATTENIMDFQRSIHKALGKNSAMLADAAEAMEKNTRGIAVATNSINRITGEIKSAIKGANEIQKNSLSVGINSNILLAENSRAISNLGIGGIIPLQERLKFMNAGFKTLDHNLLEVAAQQNLTNQNTGPLIKVSQDFVSKLRMNASEVGTLIKTIHLDGRARRVQSELLLDTLSKLTDSLATVSLISPTANIAEAVSNITSQVPKLRDQIVTFTNAFLDGKNLDKRAREGTQELVNRLLDAKSPAEATTILTAAIHRSAKYSQDNIKNMGSLNARLLTLDAALDIQGKQYAQAGIQLSHALRTSAQFYNESTTDFRNTFEGQVAKYTSTLQGFILNNFPTVMDHYGMVITGMLVPATLSLKSAIVKNTVALTAGGSGRGAGPLKFLGKALGALTAIGLVVTAGTMVYDAVRESTRKNEESQSKVEKAMNKVAEVSIKRYEAETGEKFGSIQEKSREQMMMAHQAFNDSIRRALFPRSESDRINQQIVDKLDELVNLTVGVEKNTKNSTGRR